MIDRLRPSGWPVRWRLALASAGLTLAILVVFAGVVGHLASERVRDDFNRDLEGAATGIAARTQILATAGGGYLYQGPVLNSVAAANGAAIRVYALDGTVIRESVSGSIRGDDGLPVQGGVRSVMTSIVNNGQTVGYVEFARSRENIESTIARIWLFIVAGVLGGTLLASLAGLAIADRAMRPVAAITTAAREIASTRDPSRAMPAPAGSDEIGELNRTLHEMLRSLDTARNERELAMRRQREFVADASHELRTPLTSVLANLELLQEELDRGEIDEGPEMVASALRSSRRMSRLVGDLLILARADADRHGPRLPCDLSVIAREATDEVSPIFGERQLQLSVAPGATVLGNRDELHRLVVNLLDNASRHTPDRSSIELTVGSIPLRDQVFLEIADDGPGIPPELRGQVFDRFARGATTADTSRNQGTGLGLAIVKSVAESHGGSVTLDDASDGGAHFRIILPLAKHRTVEPAGA